MKSAAIYVRVSTGPQEKDGTSLQTQREACLQKAAELGYEVPDDFAFSEVWSGADLDRPLLSQVRDLVKARAVEAVICYATDRLARKAVHIAILAEEWERRGISLVFVSEPLDGTPEGQLIRYVKGYAAEVEREKIRERTIRGKRVRAQSGKLPGASHSRLYGYTYDPKTGVRVVNAEQAYWVQHLFDWTASGMSLNEVTLRLRDFDVPTFTGSGFWRRSTIYKMLRNEAYKGTTYAFRKTTKDPVIRLKPGAKTKRSTAVLRPREEWLEIPGATPAIVDTAIFDAVQERLDRNRCATVGNNYRHYLLRGLIICGQCGSHFRGKTMSRKRRSGERYERSYYTCMGQNRIARTEPCTNVTVSADVLEGIVWGEVEKLLTSPELVFDFLKKQEEEGQSCEYWEGKLAEVNVRLRALAKREYKLIVAYEFGLEEEQVRSRKAALDAERADLVEQQARFQEQLRVAQEMSVDFDGVCLACDRVRSGLGKLTFQEKRLALEALNVQLVIHPASMVFQGVLPRIGANLFTTSLLESLDTCPPAAP